MDELIWLKYRHHIKRTTTNGYCKRDQTAYRRWK